MTAKSRNIAFSRCRNVKQVTGEEKKEEKKDKTGKKEKKDKKDKKDNNKTIP